MLFKPLLQLWFFQLYQGSILLLRPASNKLEMTYANKSHTCMLNLFNALPKVSKEGKIVADYMQGIQIIIDDFQWLVIPWVMEKLSFTHSIVLVRNKKNLQTSFMLETHRCHLKNYMTNFLIMHESFLKWEEANKGIPPSTSQFN